MRSRHAAQPGLMRWECRLPATHAKERRPSEYGRFVACMLGSGHPWATPLAFDRPWIKPRLRDISNLPVVSCTCGRGVQQCEALRRCLTAVFQQTHCRQRTGGGGTAGGPGGGAYTSACATALMVTDPAAACAARPPSVSWDCVTARLSPRSRKPASHASERPWGSSTLTADRHL